MSSVNKKKSKKHSERKKSTSGKSDKSDLSDVTDVIDINDADFPGFSSEDAPLKKTSEWMTKYEYSHLIACRSLQLSQGINPLIDVDGDYNTLSIAERELNTRVIPLAIRRVLPDGTEEMWNPNEMHIRNY